MNWAQVESICAGINEHRAGKGLPPVALYLRATMHSGEEMAVGEHVVIRREIVDWSPYV